MQPHFRRLAPLAAVLLAALAGCASKKTEDFTPPAARARAALEKALEAWQEGHPPGAVPGSEKPAIQVADSGRKPGEKLLGYEVLKEETESSGHPSFTVRLKLPGGAREARYVVFGIDPLIVYSEPDYRKLSGSGM